MILNQKSIFCCFYRWFLSPHFCKKCQKSWNHLEILFLSGSAFSLSNNVSGSAFFHLCNISKLHLFLSQLSTQVLVHALVTFHLDYSLYAILSGLPKELLNWFQMVHNSAARIINCTKSTDHITHNLTQLHWLPIRQCIQYRFFSSLSKCLMIWQPQCLSDLLHPHTPSYTQLSYSTDCSMYQT